MLANAASDSLLVHGTCVALDGRGALLRGEPGCGKSDLALRFISAYRDQSAMLLSDDQVRLLRVDDGLAAEAPENIAGKLEVRGVGIIATAHAARVRLDLIVEMRPATEIERMPPDPQPGEIVLGIPLRVGALDPFQASAPVKLKLLMTGEI